MWKVFESGDNINLFLLPVRGFSTLFNRMKTLKCTHKSTVDHILSVAYIECRLHCTVCTLRHTALNDTYGSEWRHEHVGFIYWQMTQQVWPYRAVGVIYYCLTRRIYLATFYQFRICIHSVDGSSTRQKHYKPIIAVSKNGIVTAFQTRPACGLINRLYLCGKCLKAVTILFCFAIAVNYTDWVYNKIVVTRTLHACVTGQCRHRTMSALHLITARGCVTLAVARWLYIVTLYNILG